MLKVTIEVSGGVAECTNKPKGVEVVIVDYDSEKVGEVETPSIYESETEIKGRIDDERF